MSSISHITPLDDVLSEETILDAGKDSGSKPEDRTEEVARPLVDTAASTLRIQKTAEARALLEIGPDELCDLNALIAMHDLDPETSRAVVQAMEEVIQERWANGDFVLKCDPLSADLAVFDEVEPLEYEFMPTRVAPGAVENGLGVLYINFPAGAEEAERRHCHPGGRIIIPQGPGIFHCPDLPGGQMPIDSGMVILMPAMQPHNFAATKGADMNVLSFHVGYADVEKEGAIIWLEN